MLLPEDDIKFDDHVDVKLKYSTNLILLKLADTYVYCREYKVQLHRFHENESILLRYTRFNRI